jgi:preprotein translocase subunit SecG
MYALFVVLLVIVSLCLIGVVLIQSGRGAGLSGAFGMGEGQAVFGSRAADVLTKATEVFAIAFMILCLLVTWQSKHSQDSLMMSVRSSAAKSSSNRALPTLEETEKMAAAAADTNSNTSADNVNSNAQNLTENSSLTSAAADTNNSSSLPADK